MGMHTWRTGPVANGGAVTLALTGVNGSSASNLDSAVFEQHVPLLVPPADIGFVAPSLNRPVHCLDCRGLLVSQRENRLYA